MCRFGGVEIQREAVSPDFHVALAGLIGNVDHYMFVGTNEAKDSLSH
jgi:hypothetical protein